MFSSNRAKPGGSGAKGGPSFIAADLVVSGDVAAGSQLQVDGRIDGNVRAETLVQGADGTIAGDIVAETVHLGGLVDGTVRARVVTLEATARITGDVTYETLSIAAGAAIEGRLTRKEGPVIEPPQSTAAPETPDVPPPPPLPNSPAADG